KDKLPVNPALKDLKKKPVVIDQPRCMFEPHALTMQEGQMLIVKNSASIAHNVRWTSFKNPGGNIQLPAGDKKEITDLVAENLPLQVQCNIHPWMSGWVGIFKHPYFAVTD